MQWTYCPIWHLHSREHPKLRTKTKKEWNENELIWENLRTKKSHFKWLFSKRTSKVITLNWKVSKPWDFHVCNIRWGCKCLVDRCKRQWMRKCYRVADHESNERKNKKSYIKNVRNFAIQRSIMLAEIKCLPIWVPFSFHVWCRCFFCAPF